MKTRIDVSPEMVTFIGTGPLPEGERLEHAVAFGYRLGAATMTFDPDGIMADVLADADIVFLVRHDACTRIFETVPVSAATWHLPSEIRGVAVALQDCRLDNMAGTTLRAAKSIELLCITFEKMREGSLIPTDGAGDLSATEAERIAAARSLIDERWHEKLTLDLISRACGINRTKLTRGFRSMFAMSVADAIADRRLGGARALLLATDLPVSSIGYRCGYLNNASFTRAFSRRYGQPPSRLRNARVAA